MTRFGRQPWLFALYAGAFTALAYLLDPGSGLGSAALGGLVFASVMSAWNAMQQRLRRRQRP